MTNNTKRWGLISTTTGKIQSRRYTTRTIARNFRSSMGPNKYKVYDLHRRMVVR